MQVQVEKLSKPKAPSTTPRSEYFGPDGFKWLIRGKLGGMPRPGIMHDIEKDFEGIGRLGISLVVTLTEEWKPPVRVMRQHGLRSLYVPIPDMEPPTMKQAMDTCEAIAGAVEAGESIVFHCHGGRGRTGTMLAAFLIWLSPSSKDAIARVKDANRNWIESESQMQFLAQFAKERQEMLENKKDKRPEPGGSGRTQVVRPLLDAIASHVNWFAPKKDSVREENVEVPTLEDRKEKQMSLDKALQSAMSGIPECLAAGYVDMDTGMLLGIQTLDSHPQEVLDVLAAATADLFQGSNIVQIEGLFKKARGTEKDENHYFHELFVFSENLLHVFMRAKKFPGHVVCFVCRKSANPGMVLTKARLSMEKVTAAV